MSNGTVTRMRLAHDFSKGQCEDGYCMWESRLFFLGKKADNDNNSTRYEFCVNARNSLALAEKCRRSV